MFIISSESKSNQVSETPLQFNIRGKFKWDTVRPMLGNFLFDRTREVNYIITRITEGDKNTISLTITSCNREVKASVNKGTKYYIIPQNT